MNEVMESLLSHQSIRAYTEQMVEEENIDQIIRAVQAAPNWNNLQHVSVIIVKEAERKEMFPDSAADRSRSHRRRFF